jgi:ERCC4-related helicase
LFENLACVFFDCTGEDAWLDTYRPVIKHTLGNIPGWKRLALSSSPSTATKQVSALVTTLPLEQIVCRALDDPDIARHVQAKHTWQVALSGENQHESYA